MDVLSPSLSCSGGCRSCLLPPQPPGAWLRGRLPPQCLSRPLCSGGPGGCAGAVGAGWGSLSRWEPDGGAGASSPWAGLPEAVSGWEGAASPSGRPPSPRGLFSFTTHFSFQKRRCRSGAPSSLSNGHSAAAPPPARPPAPVCPSLRPLLLPLPPVWVGRLGGRGGLCWACPQLWARSRDRQTCEVSGRWTGGPSCGQEHPWCPRGRPG